MLKITADLFSGIPNPEWIVDGDDAEAVLRDLAQHRSAVAPVDSGFQGLDNRGLLVEVLSEHISEELGLPPMFKLANGGTQLESKGIEVAERLINAMLKDGAATHPAITNPESITQEMHRFFALVDRLPHQENALAEEWLGYSGVQVICFDDGHHKLRTITIFNGIVTIQEGKINVGLLDHGRQLEEWTVKTGRTKLDPELYRYVLRELTSGSQH